MGAVDTSKLDFFNENFEEYFIKKVSSMTQNQMAMMPIELKNKLFQGNLQRHNYKLKFAEKAYILSTVFNQDIIITIKDEMEGIGPEEFGSAIAAQKGKIRNSELLNNVPTNNMFIIGNKELMSPMVYLNHVFCSEIYSLVSLPVIREKSKAEKQHIKRAIEYRGLIDAFMHYESQKKLISREFKLDMPRWYALLYFGNREKLGRAFYQDQFKYAYSSSRVNLYGALKGLVDDGYMVQRGKRTELKYSLTAKGLDTLNQIIDRVILNYKKSV